MNADLHNVQRFLALSALYFRLTGKTARDSVPRELEEFLEIINDDAPPAMSTDQYLC